MTTGQTDLTPKARRTRAALLTAARSIIAEDGLDALTVMRVCDQAQVGRTSFYNYFPDVAVLALHVAEATAQDIRHAFNATHEGTPRGAARLGACLGMLVEQAAANQQDMLLLTSLARQDGPVRNILSDEIAAELAAIRGLDAADRDALRMLIVNGIIATARDVAGSRMAVEVAERSVAAMIRACRT